MAAQNFGSPMTLNADRARQADPTRRKGLVPTGWMTAVALAIGASPAAAQVMAPAPLFDTFKRVCADNRGAFARTTVDPEVQSWKRFALPIPLPLKDVKLSEKSIRVKSFEGGVLRMFIAGSGSTTSADGPARFEFCSIGGKPADLQAVIREVEAMVGQPPIKGEKGTTSFRYHQAASGKRTPLPAGKLREVAKGHGPGEVVSIDAAVQRGQTIINYTSIKL
jgi:hypothetical protein